MAYLKYEKAVRLGLDEGRLQEAYQLLDQWTGYAFFTASDSLGRSISRRCPSSVIKIGSST